MPVGGEAVIEYPLSHNWSDRNAAAVNGRFPPVAALGGLSGHLGCHVTVGNMRKHRPWRSIKGPIGAPPIARINDRSNFDQATVLIWLGNRPLQPMPR